MARLPPSSGGMGRWARSAAAVAGGTFVATGALIAALPTVVSSQLGLETLLRVANTMYPGEIELQSATLGWHQKIQIRGLKMRGRKGTSDAAPLLELALVNSTGTLWQLAMRSVPMDVSVTRAVVNCEFDIHEEDFKLLRHLEEMGILSKAPTTPTSTRAEPQPGQGSKPPFPAAGGVRGEETEAMEETESVASSTPATRSPNKVMTMLSKADSTMDFTADLHLPGDVHIYVSEGKLLVPSEMRDMVGPHLHVSAALGEAELKEWADQVGEDVSWAEQTENVAGPSASVSLGQLSPTALSLERRRGHGNFQPGMLQLEAEHMKAGMRIWHDMRQDLTFLHQPAQARLGFTPQFSKFGLVTANPILANVADLRSGQGHVMMNFIPDGMQLPYTKATFQISPMALTLRGSDGVVGTICSALGLSSSSLQSAKIEASISQMDVEVIKGGSVKTKRVDMTLGRPSSRSSLSLSLWGSMDPQTDSIDMVIALSPSALSQLGITDLPEDYLLQIPLRGTTDRPKPHMRGPYASLMQLLRRQVALDQRNKPNEAKPVKSDSTGQEEPGGSWWGSAARMTLKVAKQAMAPTSLELRRIEETIAQDMAKIPKRTETAPWDEQ